MAGNVAEDLRKKTDAAWANVTKPLEGMEPYLDRSEAPGEWTTRQVICHLLGKPGADMVVLLKTFTGGAMPVVEIEPGQTYVDDARKRMSLRQLVDALDAQRRAVQGYVDGLSDAELQQRKARIPLFKQFMGTDEIPLARFVGAMFEFHWNDHAGQLGKIRKAVGLPLT
jgi:hypothetical protein